MNIVINKYGDYIEHTDFKRISCPHCSSLIQYGLEDIKEQKKHIHKSSWLFNKKFIYQGFNCPACKLFIPVELINIKSTLRLKN